MAPVRTTRWADVHPAPDRSPSTLAREDIGGWRASTGSIIRGFRFHQHDEGTIMSKEPAADWEGPMQVD
ncbi:MAG TPA: hypothetical protein VEQ60_09470, partial [Longimicrobium sp.]|nr:hypothetical protein [Longimicrobium sp.]